MGCLHHSDILRTLVWRGVAWRGVATTDYFLIINEVLYRISNIVKKIEISASVIHDSLLLPPHLQTAFCH